jgi:predicted AAA+ superfamily ATPase
MARVESLVTRIESVLPQLLQPDWNSSIAFRYRKRSSGHGTLEPCDIGAMRLDDLQEISDQKEKIRRNTEQFCHRPANNVLLTGSRGTGKSSLIKACLN